MQTNDKKDRRDDIFSRNVRAGKRTYFFDVKATRMEDYYLTITESTKRFNDDGSFHYEKHRLFLYKEDFEKFSNCLAEVTKYIIDEKGVIPIRGESNQRHNNGAYKPANIVAPENIVAEASISEEIPSADVGEEGQIGTVKTEEETDLVEDAHEKAMVNASDEEPTEESIEAPAEVEVEATPVQEDIASESEVDGNAVDPTNGQIADSENIVSENAEKETNPSR